MEFTRFMGVGSTKLKYAMRNKEKNLVTQLPYGIWQSCSPETARMALTVHCLHRFGSTLSKHDRESSHIP